LFEAFVSNFGDEYAIVWKKTNELVEIPGNDGKLSYSDAHRILTDYLKQYPDKIWGVQIVPRVEIVTHIYPAEETEPKSFVDEVDEISIVEGDKDQAKTDEIEEISPIKEIDVFTIKETEETLPTEDIKGKFYDEEVEDFISVDETEGTDIEDDTEALSVEEGTETMMETEVIDEFSTLEDTDYPSTTKEIVEIDDSLVEETEEITNWDDTETFSVEEDTEIEVETEVIEEISTVDDKEDLVSTSDLQEISISEDLEEATLEKDAEAKVKEQLLSNIPSPHIILSSAEEEVSSGRKIEDLPQIEEFSTTKDLEEVPPEKKIENKVKGELLSNIPDPYIILSKTEEISSAEETEDLPLIKEISTTKDIEEVPPEKDTETNAKGELLSNIPDPYIILSRAEELDKTNDEYKLKGNLEEE
ncbi:MAG: hypothetical protein ACTSQH_08565, partial [Candidatus Hodarchaeales archaeon]